MSKYSNIQFMDVRVSFKESIFQVMYQLPDEIVNKNSISKCP